MEQSAPAAYAWSTLIGAAFVKPSGPAARRPARHHRPAGAVPGGPEARRLEQSAGKILGVGPAARLFDDDAEEVVTRVVVAPFGAGREVHRLIAKQRQHRVVRERQGHDSKPPGHGRVVLDSGGVVEELPHGHTAARGRPIGKELAQLIVETELAVLHQRQHRGRGELLGDGADQIHRVGGGDDPLLEVRGAERLRVDGASTPRQRN